MLVLTRRVGETITIGDGIRITVTRINGGSSIKLAIDAPREIAVLRPEAVDKKIA